MTIWLGTGRIALATAQIVESFYDSGWVEDF
jgi:hypothetical protein